MRFDSSWLLRTLCLTLFMAGAGCRSTGGDCRSCCCASTPPNTLSEAEQKEGWKLLWDGKTTAGWRSVRGETFPAKGWITENGELTVLAKTAGGGGGDIITTEKYGDFILKAEFKLTKGANSGIKYFFNKEVNKGATMEYQVLCPTHKDAGAGINGNRRTAALYDVLPAPTARVREIGEWNTAMIVSKGNKVEHWLNGVKVLEFDRASAEFKAAVATSKFAKMPGWGAQKDGHILLQDHNDRVSYRNLKIKTVECCK